MSAGLVCPGCKSRLALLDVAREFHCPKCQVPLISTGWRTVRLVDGISFVVGGCLIVVLWAGLGWIAGLLTTGALIAGDVYARRALLTIKPAATGLASNERETT